MPVRDAHPLPGTDVVVAAASGRPVRVRVVVHGRARDAGAGPPPLLLVHGLPTTSYVWRDVVRALEHTAGCLVPDLLGLGGSERPRARRDLALDGQAQALLGVLDALGVDRVAVAGQDLGGAVAVHLAALAPQRVAGLVLLGTAVHADAWPVPAVLPLLVPGIGEVSTALLHRVPSLARRLLAASLGGARQPELDHYLAPLLSPGAGPALLRLLRAVDLVAVEAAFRLVRAAPPPALVLWGERDRLHRLPYGRRVAGELPGAGWVPVADAGHLLAQERPERVAEELAGFLADLAG
jgi:2-hydroxymuconate-semialdehyde hydrolase